MMLIKGGPRWSETGHCGSAPGAARLGLVDSGAFRINFMNVNNQ
jgi:hypothetical protein